MGNAAGPKLKIKPAKAAPAKTVVQKKLAVGPTGDRFEQEANRVADSVVSGSAPSMSAPPPTISGLGVQRMTVSTRSSPEKTDEDQSAPEQRAQRAFRLSGPEAPLDDLDGLGGDSNVAQTAPRGGPASTPGRSGGTAPSAVEGSIQRMRGSTAPGLDSDTRGFMENRIGTGFGDVRVHSNRAANEAADALDARAFTVGQDVFFGAGQYDTNTTEGQRLLAHELTHTVQQNGGTAATQRVQRAGKAKSKSTTKPEDTTPVEKTKTLSGRGWTIDFNTTEGSQGTITVPKLELPEVAGTLKGTKSADVEPASITGLLPALGKSYTRPPIAKRSSSRGSAPANMWVAHAREKYAPNLKTKLETQLSKQKNAATISDTSDKKFYVLKRGGGKRAVKATSSEFLISGTIDELAKHDAVVRPMLRRTGAYMAVQADHILEDQLGGLDSARDLWLLDAKYNMSIGPQIDSRINDSLRDTVRKANNKKERDKVELDGTIPDDMQVFRRKWTIVFKTVSKRKYSGEPRTYWTKKEIAEGKHLPFYKALTNKELFETGFKFDKRKRGKVKASRINVFPAPDGGRPYAFKVSQDGKKLQKPGHFFRGVEVLKSLDYIQPTADNQGQTITHLQVRYTRRKNSKQKNSPKISSEGQIEVRHDPRLGFGGYVTRESIREAFKNPGDFPSLSPLTFPDVHVTSDGVLSAKGQILSNKALLPKLKIPIELWGDEILINFPVPTEKLNFGPVSVTDATVDIGIGKNGFFIGGSAAIAVDGVGSGSLRARGYSNNIRFDGDFNLDLDFLKDTNVNVVYWLKNDDFKANAKTKVKKGALPGVESGDVAVSVTRESFGLTGTLYLGGILAGSSITVGYTPETGLIIEGKDLPLPVEKLPGVSNAKVTVRALRNPFSGTWMVSGGGKANFSVAGALGILDVLFDGEAVSFYGKVIVVKGPASGWLEIWATNRTLDDTGKPIEGGPVGDLNIWGKGEATIAFGKVLTGTAGLQYTPDGRVIISGEIALPPKYDLFPRKDFGGDKPLVSFNPPEFWIWGVKLGPVGFGIFAYVKAGITFVAYVGPGQLLDTKVQATVDLDKPEEATVVGNARFFAPAYAGFVLTLGGGLKARLGIAYARGEVGLEGALGAALDVSIDTTVKWSPTSGLEAGSLAKAAIRPKFTLDAYAEVAAGVDLYFRDIEKSWGPWKKRLGEFGPDMELSVAMPVHWSEKDGLDLSLDNISVKRPSLDAKGIMKNSFDALR